MGNVWKVCLHSGNGLATPNAISSIVQSIPHQRAPKAKKANKTTTILSVWCLAQWNVPKNPDTRAFCVVFVIDLNFLLVIPKRQVSGKNGGKKTERKNGKKKAKKHTEPLPSLSFPSFRFNLSLCVVGVSMMTGEDVLVASRQVGKGVEEIKAKIYERINKHFREYSSSFDIGGDVADEVEQLKQHLDTVKLAIQVFPSCSYISERTNCSFACACFCLPAAR